MARWRGGAVARWPGGRAVTHLHGASCCRSTTSSIPTGPLLPPSPASPPLTIGIADATFFRFFFFSLLSFVRFLSFFRFFFFDPSVFYLFDSTRSSPVSDPSSVSDPSPVSDLAWTNTGPNPSTKYAPPGALITCSPLTYTRAGSLGGLAVAGTPAARRAPRPPPSAPPPAPALPPSSADGAGTPGRTSACARSTSGT